ncbi:MAG: DNA translocase FtsK [Thermodesulfovibrionales bacterium]|jgi:S-DNA-T family DNA segregation ATPase FtsK/SpoIIIE
MSRIREIKGVLSILGGLYTGLSLATHHEWDRSFFTFSTAGVKNAGGVAGAYLSDFILTFLGIAGFLIPLFFCVSGARRLMNRESRLTHPAGVALLTISISLLSQLTADTLSLGREPGGAVGGALSGLLTGLLSPLGAVIVCVALILVSAILLSPVPLSSFIRLKGAERGEGKSKWERPPVRPGDKEPEKPDRRDLVIAGNPAPAPLAVKNQAAGKAVEQEGLPAAREKGEGYILPSLSFLKDGEGAEGPKKDELNTAAANLEKKLTDFGVSGRIRTAHPGPVVTMFEFEPAAGVKINRIVSLADDLALALRAPSIRVYPIAGKATIGLEVPNRNRASVSFKDVIGSDPFSKGASLLSLALGKDIFGNPVVTDLARMPHLLVAGATGSGKSVSINAMIMSFLYKATPDELKMLMIDPKLLELSAYNDIPHLISPVITNPKEASEGLKKMVYEMERRYRLLAEKGARNIESFNSLVSPSERLPFIVVIIDELADLMFTAPSDVEGAIARLAQMARASGIHLILATQRPSVDVITGLIKANFPARISFQVTSRIDSRTILDSQGAEQLLGRGDMLFMVPGSKMTRIHGAYVSDQEVATVTEFVRSQGRPDYTAFENIVIADDKSGGDEAEGGERDDMYQRVIEFGESAGEVSISSIQRRFKIGYNRAARMMDLLAEDGYVGPPRGAGKPRDFIGRRI